VMTNRKKLSTREKRQRAISDLVGDDLDEQSRIALETAEMVREAARFMREMRESAGMTQGQLGKKLGVSQARISELEKGNSPEGMSYALLRRAAKACNRPDWPPAPMEAVEKVIYGREIETHAFPDFSKAFLKPFRRKPEVPDPRTVCVVSAQPFNYSIDD